MFRFAQKEHLIVPAHIDHLPSLRDFITQIGTKYGYSKKLVSAFKIAIDEAATNIIKHAYEGEGYITIQAIIRRKSLTINMIDQGAFFDPKWAKAPDLKDPEGLGDKVGLGIFMMRKLMDEIGYQKTQAGNELSLTKEDKYRKRPFSLGYIWSLPPALRVRYFINAIVLVTLANAGAFSYLYFEADRKVTAAIVESGRKTAKRLGNRLSFDPEKLRGPNAESEINSIILPEYRENILELQSVVLEDTVGHVAWSTVSAEVDSLFFRPGLVSTLGVGVLEFYLQDSVRVLEVERSLNFDKGETAFSRVHVFLSGDHIDNEIELKRLYYLKLALAALGASYILLALLSYIITRPIRKLAEWIKATRQGEIRTDLDIDGSSELGEIAQAFTEITQRFNESQKHLEHRERFEKEIHLAKDIQNSLLPAAIPTLEKIELAAYYEAAVQVSGDYYDFIEIDKDHLGIIIADVSGKGVPGSMVMTMIRTALRTEARGILDAAEVLTRVHEFVAADMKYGMFVTMFYVILDKQACTINFASAGHTPLLLHRACTGKTFYLNPIGCPVGIAVGKRDFFKQNIESETIQLDTDDTILLYTDGVTEARNPKTDSYGEGRLLTQVRKHHRLKLDAFLEKIKNSVFSFREDSPQHDDITIVAIRRKAATGEEADQPIVLDEDLSVETKFLSIEDTTKILDVVARHPDYDPAQISQELNRPRYKHAEVPDGKIESELIRQKLNAVDLRKRYAKLCEVEQRKPNPPGTPRLTLSGNIRTSKTPKVKSAAAGLLKAPDAAQPPEQTEQPQLPRTPQEILDFAPSPESDFVFGTFIDDLLRSTPGSERLDSSDEGETLEPPPALALPAPEAEPPETVAACQEPEQADVEESRSEQKSGAEAENAVDDAGDSDQEHDEPIVAQPVTIDDDSSPAELEQAEPAEAAADEDETGTKSDELSEDFFSDDISDALVDAILGNIEGIARAEVALEATTAPEADASETPVAEKTKDATPSDTNHDTPSEQLVEAEELPEPDDAAPVAEAAEDPGMGVPAVEQTETIDSEAGQQAEPEVAASPPAGENATVAAPAKDEPAPPEAVKAGTTDDDEVVSAELLTPESEDAASGAQTHEPVAEPTEPIETVPGVESGMETLVPEKEQPAAQPASGVEKTDFVAEPEQGTAPPTADTEESLELDQPEPVHNVQARARQADFQEEADSEITDDINSDIESAEMDTALATPPGATDAAVPTTAPAPTDGEDELPPESADEELLGKNIDVEQPTTGSATERDSTSLDSEIAIDEAIIQDEVDEAAPPQGDASSERDQDSSQNVIASGWQETEPADDDWLELVQLGRGWTEGSHPLLPPDLPEVADEITETLTIPESEPAEAKPLPPEPEAEQFAAEEPVAEPVTPAEDLPEAPLATEPIIPPEPLDVASFQSNTMDENLHIPRRHSPTQDTQAGEELNLGKAKVDKQEIETVAGEATKAEAEEVLSTEHEGAQPPVTEASKSSDSMFDHGITDLLGQHEPPSGFADEVAAQADLPDVARPEPKEADIKVRPDFEESESQGQPDAGEQLDSEIGIALSNKGIQDLPHEEIVDTGHEKVEAEEDEIEAEGADQDSEEGAVAGRSTTPEPQPEAEADADSETEPDGIESRGTPKLGQEQTTAEADGESGQETEQPSEIQQEPIFTLSCNVVEDKYLPRPLRKHRRSRRRKQAEHQPQQVGPGDPQERQKSAAEEMTTTLDSAAEVPPQAQAPRGRREPGEAASPEAGSGLQSVQPPLAETHSEDPALITRDGEPAVAGVQTTPEEPAESPETSTEVREDANARTPEQKVASTVKPSKDAPEGRRESRAAELELKAGSERGSVHPGDQPEDEKADESDSRALPPTSQSQPTDRVESVIPQAGRTVETGGEAKTAEQVKGEPVPEQSPAAKPDAGQAASDSPPQPPVEAVPPGVLTSKPPGDDSSEKKAAPAEPPRQRPRTHKEELLRGIDHYKAKAYEDAIIAFKAALRLAPDSMEAYAMLGNAFFRNNMYQEALTAYEQIDQEIAGELAIHENIGLIYWKLGQLDEATTAWRQALQNNPERKELARRLRIAETQRGAQQPAPATLAETDSQETPVVSPKPAPAIVENGSGEAMKLVQAGIEQYRNNDYESAIQTFRAAINHFPNKKEAYSFLGNAYFRNQMYSEAAEIYERLLSLNDDSTSVLENLALIHFKQGDYQRAVDKWKRVLAKKPERHDLEDRIEKTNQLL